MQCKHEFLKEFLHFLWIGNYFVPVNKISLFFPSQSQANACVCFERYIILNSDHYNIQLMKYFQLMDNPFKLFLKRKCHYGQELEIIQLSKERFL